MSDTVKAWIEERRAAMDEAAEALTPDGHETDFLGLPRALNALNAVLELCDEWDREVSIPGVPGVECEESFRVRLVIQKAIEGAIND